MVRRTVRKIVRRHLQRTVRTRVRTLIIAGVASGAIAIPAWVTSCSGQPHIPAVQPSASGAYVPDVPGATDPRVTQANIETTICVPGYTKTVRPSTDYTNPIKARLMKRSDTSLPPSAFELDHVIPLAVGGSPTSKKNLWLEPLVAVTPDGKQAGFRVKDKLENSVHDRVCSGRISLAAGQRMFGKDWVRHAS